MISEMMTKHEAFMAPTLFTYCMERVREVSSSFITQTVKKDQTTQEHVNEAFQDLPDNVFLIDVKSEVKNSSSPEGKNITLLRVENTIGPENDLDTRFPYNDGQLMEISSDYELVPSDQLTQQANTRSSTKKWKNKLSDRHKTEAKSQRSSKFGVSKKLSDENKKLKAEIKAFKFENKRLDSETEYLKHVIRKERGKNTTLAADKEAVEVQLDRSRNINSKLWQELGTRKDNVHHVQSVDQISETEIASKYEQLSQQVMHWIEESFSFVEGGIEELLAAEKRTQFVLHSPEARRARDLLSKFPDGAELVIQHEVFQILRKEVLETDCFLAALGPRLNPLLTAIKHGMTLSEPSRDPRTMKDWRSKALIALLASPDFEPHIAMKVKDVTQRLYQHLLQVFPALLQQQDKMQKLQEDVVIPALKSAHLIRTLPMEYEFGPAFCSSPAEVQQMVPFSWLKETVVKDVVTRKTLKAVNAVVPDETGFIGEIIMILEPRLERVTHGQLRNVQIRKAVTAVKLVAPVRKQAERPRVA